jgi:hypothetical protein
MTKQTINIGTSPNDGSGDPIRTAMDKINDNFDELYGGLFPGAVNATSFTIGSTFSANSTKLVANGATINSTAVNATSFTVGSSFVANATGIYHTSNTLNFGSNTNAANGYTYLPNGFKMNWGWVSANSSNGSATFTSGFSVNSYSVVASSNAGATYSAFVISTNSTVAEIRTSNATSTNVFWQAIGY